MSEVDYKLSQVAANEAKSFSMYTIENRALPSMIDGMKPVQRFYLYSSIVNSKSDFRKVSAVSGVISDYGYNHGESSAAGSGQLMAADWANNVCLVKGQGNFGTRQKPFAAAARYTYTKLHENFNKFIKDVEIAPEHFDPEHVPPAFYVPVIPLVLANGADGVAVGFATSIVPRSVQSLVASCTEYLKSGNLIEPVVSFPKFNGTVDFEDGRYIAKGMYRRKGQTVLIIDEIPPEINHEKYVQHLNDLETDGKIVGYDDDCDESGFKFTVTLKRDFRPTEESIVKMFKLHKPFTENMNVIDWKGKLRNYQKASELIKDFCDYRLSFLEGRIKHNLQDCQRKQGILNAKIKLIWCVCDGEVNPMNMKRQELVGWLESRAKVPTSAAEEAVSMSVYNMTADYLEKLSDDLEKVKKELDYWNSTTPKEQFLSDLKAIK